MKIVVTGGSGHIGTYLVPMLVNAGHEVVSVTRGQANPYVSDPAWQRVETVQLDRQQDPEFAEKIAALDPDVVVDLISFTLILHLKKRYLHFHLCMPRVVLCSVL